MSTIAFAVKFLLYWAVCYFTYFLAASLIIWNWTISPGDLSVTGRVFFVIYMLLTMENCLEEAAKD